MAEVSARVEAWKLAWESRDAARVAALYAPDSTHESALVPQIYPELGRTTLHGPAEITEYARRGLARYRELRFAIISVVESGDRAAVEYRRHSNLDGANPKHVMELIEWRGDLIAAVRVFHF
ncbi:MAG TPA: nuclear transport factor 2 family protein [Candidatus Acidoferrales bacterium]|nr:nuclear transport factor 2 family protein [Candidatus Acidoferrales bacterium]